MPNQMQLWTSIGKGRYDEVIAFGGWKNWADPWFGDLRLSKCWKMPKKVSESLILSYLDTQHMTPQKIFKGVIVGFFLLI